MDRAGFFLRLRAGFGVWRYYTGGDFQQTAPVLPPSAACGLLCVLADAPWESLNVARVAVGRLREAEPQRVLQHTLVHPTKSVDAAGYGAAHGEKFWTRPARRPFLSGIDVVVGIQAPAETAECLCAALADGPILWAGDTCFGFERVEVVGEVGHAEWAAPVPGGSGPAFPLDVRVDRADATKSVRRLFRWSPDLAEAWVKYAKAEAAKRGHTAVG
jgi:CRISPR-associated protein Cas5t